MSGHHPSSPLFPYTPLFRSAASRLQRLITSADRDKNAYYADEFMTDLRNGIWSELGTNKVIDKHRRNLDRKSTRLNSSHANISYAVFCLKKKNNTSQELSLM